MNAKDEVPNSPEVKTEQEPETPVTAPVEKVEPVEEEITAPTATVQADDTEKVTDTPSPAAEATESGTSASEQIAQQAKDFAAKLVQQLQTSFGVEKKSTIIIVALVLSLIPLIILADKVLGFIDNIPLLEPLLELVGLAYAVWFVYRYLIFAKTRQELTDSIQGIKSKILGDDKPN